MFDLDVRCGDVNDIELEREAYDMVHAALLFEYLEWRVLLPRVAMALRPGALLSVILQLPSDVEPVGDPYAIHQLAEAGIAVPIR